MKKVKWFKTKSVAAVFAAVAFVVGFLFIDKGITGNVILDNKYPIDVMSLIGVLLVFCSAILAVYIIKKQ
ncbi:MAG TPA: hypothetical protein VMV95_04025 [Bacillota bacterium]|nr:hypothetical protein [Bacillota bacterium]